MNESLSVITVAAASAAVIGTGILVLSNIIVSLARRGERERRVSEEISSAESTAERVQRLTNALSESSQIVDELEGEIERRHAFAEELQREVDKLESLRELNQDQVNAIAQTIDAPIRRQGRRSLVLNIVFFLLGVAATAITTLLVG